MAIAQGVASPLRHRVYCPHCAWSVRLRNNLYAGEFFPASDRPELLVSLTLPANASQSETQSTAEKLEKALAGNRNVERFSTYVGSGAIRFYLPMDVLLANENIAQIVVVAKDLKARDRLHRQLNRILATRFSDIITRVSPWNLGPRRLASQIPGEWT